MGRLTRNPELKTTPNGVSVCSFTLAVNRRFKNANGDYDADFINCIAWRQTAEFISKNFVKGRMIAIVGSLQTRNYEKDGQKHFITEVSAEEVAFTGDRGSEKAPAPSSAGQPFDFSNMPMPDNVDDLPY